jgi:DNA polymerase-1
VKSVRNREKLAAARDQILQNRKMVELDCDTPLPVPLDDLRLRPDYPGLIRVCEDWELKSVLKEVQDEAAKVGVATQSELLL